MVSARRVGLMVGSEDIWFCYMLRCSDGSFYVGAARDPELRVRRHNQGLGAKHTAMRRPVSLIWQEAHTSERAARGREAELKGWRRSKKLELIARCGDIHPSP
jgi:predicted GIY-YIG superfamily endonuclease